MFPVILLAGWCWCLTSAFSTHHLPFVANTPVTVNINPETTLIVPVVTTPWSPEFRIGVWYNDSTVMVYSSVPNVEGTLAIYTDVNRSFQTPLVTVPPRSNYQFDLIAPLPAATLYAHVAVKQGENGFLVIKGKDSYYDNIFLERNERIVLYNHQNESLTSKLVYYTNLPRVLLEHQDCSALYLSELVDTPCTVKSLYDLSNSLSRNRRQTAGFRFSKDQYNVQYSEKVKATVLLKLNVKNQDGVKYFLIRDTFGSSVFSIDANSGALRLETKLDREEASQITIPVGAENLQKERIVTEVVINVEDANDNTPEFILNEYKVSVQYSTPIASTVVTVKAIDRDIDLNSEIVYSMEPSADNQDDTFFKIDPRTGVIKTVKFMDSQKEYRFAVVACDQGTPVQLKSNVTVIVYVQNATDSSNVIPVFKQSTYYTQIPEIARTGSVVATVTAQTRDNVQYSILPGTKKSQNYPKKFEIDPDTGVITRIAALDHEEVAVYYFQVKVRTTQMPAFEDYAIVIIQLQDFNDNIPLFNPSSYDVEILEELPRGTYVTTVIAEDGDTARNSDITYSLSSKDLADFTIDPKRGHIYTSRNFDREKKHQYTINVKAKDSGVPSQSRGTKVQVTVLDLNDCPPEFKSKNIDVKLKEDAKIGDAVTTLTTVDEDVGSNAAVTYSFVSGDVDKFELDEFSGLVKVNTELDYEKKQEYLVVVEATDGKFTDEATIKISVVNINDNPPKFEQKEYSLSLREDVSVGTRLLTLEAVDDDWGVDQKIKYRILTRSRDDETSVPFRVDADSGALYVDAVLDRETRSFYQLTVTATDYGNLSDSAEVMINITDVNDNSPRCLPPSVGHVSEDDARDTHVLTVNATDADAGSNSQLRYALLNNEKKFDLDTVTGDMWLRGALDREQESEYDVKIEVTDLAKLEENRRSTICTYTIKVTDINDNPPRFVKISHEVSISEMKHVGDHVMTMQAEDPDVGKNGAFDYTIEGGNSPVMFDIHPRTGEVTVIGKLDYETRSFYKLDIKVTDLSPPFHEASTSLIIKVTDGNDNTPVFVNPPSVIQVKEDKKRGSQIVKVEAHDTDQGDNGQIVYTLSTSNADVFNIDSTGTIYLLSELDRETQDSYRLDVVATDRGETPLSARTTLTVEVLDVNDNPPMSRFPEYHISVTPNQRRKQLIKLDPVDVDDKTHGPPFSYAIVGGNDDGIFGMSGPELVIELPEKLLEDKLYTIVIQIADNGGLTSNVTVNLSCIPENKYSPSGEAGRATLVLEGEKLTPTTRTLLWSRGNHHMSRDDHMSREYSRVMEYVGTDTDKGTVLMYDLVEEEGGDNLFVMAPNGTLYVESNIRPGVYKLSAKLFDGIHVSMTTIIVEVLSVSGEAGMDPLILQLDDVTMETFKSDVFAEGVAKILEIKANNVKVMDVSVVTTRRKKKRSVVEVVQVVAIVSNPRGGFYTSSTLKQALSERQYLFESVTGYTVADLDLNPCLKEPCSGTGRCESVVKYKVSDNTVAEVTQTYRCICPAGFTGHGCKERIPCGINPCNDGACHVKDGKEMCECDDNWTGLYCDIPVRHCAYSPCQNDGVCRDEAIGFTCVCKNGFKGDRCEKQILPADLCQDAMCSKYSTCTSGGTGYTCTCNDTWSGPYCTYKADNSESDKCYNNPCLHGGVCKKYRTGYMCQCEPGFEGQNCERNIDDCKLSPCMNGGSCVDGVDGFVCECREGYNGRRCEYATAPCDGNPCLNGGFCYNVDNDRGYLCHCQSGYLGEHCETPTTPPSYCDPSPCVNAEMCTASLTNYTCTCKPRFKGRNCEIRDAAAQGCDLNPCLNGGSCNVISGSFVPYECVCQPGFTGSQCEENIDECRFNPCRNNGVCEDRINTYECKCNPGYSGKNCESRSNPCSKLPCRNNGKCFNVGDSYVCQCPAAYKGRNCQDMLDYCPDYYCRNNGKCGKNSDGSVRCICLLQYYGEYCQHRYKHCHRNPCLNGGKCIESPDGSFRCDCPENFDGPLCQQIQINIQEGGYGYVAMDVKKKLHQSTMSLKLRTKSSRGVVLFVSRIGAASDVLEVSVNNSRLYIKYSLGGDVVSFYLSKIIADNTWHTVTLILNSKDISALLDECHDLKYPSLSCSGKASVAGGYFTLDTDTPLFLGGTDFPYHHLSRDDLKFSGCLRDFVLDDDILDFSQAIDSHRVSTDCFPGCMQDCSGQDRCMVHGGEVSCECLFGKTGFKCQDTSKSITLDGTYRIWARLQETITPNSFSMSLQLRTRVPDAMVVMLTSDMPSYLIVNLVDGQPRVILSRGSNDVTVSTVTLYGVTVSNGEWHTVVISKLGDSLQLEVDGTSRVYNFTVGHQTQFQTSLYQTLSVGEVSPDTRVTQHVTGKFEGCLRDIRINGREVNLLVSTETTQVQTEGDVKEGCNIAGGCTENDCLPFQQCVEVWGDYRCQCRDNKSGPECKCPLGYTGPGCLHEIDECKDDPCGAHSTRCVDKVADYTCTCLPGYTGKNCKVEEDECAWDPCRNGGECLDLANGYLCRCPARYIGDRCEIDSTPCKDEPCLHGGKCTEYGAGRFGCQCNDKWGGDYCQLPRSCDIDPCLHGTCKAGSPFVTCECDEYYTGPTCEQLDCASFCVNGNCNGEQCVCNHGWMGEYCEIESESEFVGKRESLNIWIIVAIVVLSILIITIIIGVIVFKRRARKYNQIPKDGPDGRPSGGGGGVPYYNQTTPYHIPKYSPDYTSPIMYQPYPGLNTSGQNSLMQMKELSLSQHTLDDEIKL